MSPNSSIPETVPVILDGTFFKIVSYSDTDDKVIAQCCNCTTGGRLSGSLKWTSNFLKHLKRVHSDLVSTYEQRKTTQGPIIKKQKLQAAATSGSSGKQQPTLQSFVTIKKSNTKRSRAENLIVNFIVKGMHPLSTVEQEGFKELIKGLNPQVEPMSRRTLGRAIDEDFLRMVTSVRNIVNDGSVEYFCLTADAWTCGGKSRAFLGITLHWISRSLERKSIALACRRFKGTHGFEKIAQLINQILSEYEIPKCKILTAVTDNGSNFVKAFSEFQETESNQEKPDAESENDSEVDSEDEEATNPIDLTNLIETGLTAASQTVELSISLPPHFRCVSHTLSLICTADIQKVLNSKIHQSTFAKCYGIWNKIGRSTKGSENVKDICGALLIRPCPTRWNSLYDSVSSLLRHQSHLAEVCELIFVPKFSNEELIYLAEYKQCLSVLANALDKLQGDCYFGILLPTLLVVEKKLSALLDLNELKYCRPLVGVLIDGLKKRFNSFLKLEDESCDAAIASMSHPYFKLRWIPTDRKESLRDKFYAVVRSLNPTPPEADVLAEDRNARRNDDFYEFPTNAELVDDSFENKLRLQCHQYFENQETTVTSLNNFPAIKDVFLKFNTPLPSSAPVERLFSYGGMILRPNRRSLNDHLFESLLLLKINANLY